jgi:hypothetical protein
MDTLNNITRNIHNEILKLRSIENLISSQKFNQLFESSSEEKKKELLEILEKKNLYSLKTWVTTHPNIDLGEMNTIRLKDIAKQKRVPNYSRMYKEELINTLQSMEGEDVGKNKEAMIVEIEMMLKEMLPEFEKSKIKLFYHEKSPLFYADIIYPAHKWLTKIYNTTFQDLKKVKKLLPASQWERYEKWQVFEACKEVKLLKIARAKLRKSVQGRPDLFKKSVIEKEVKRIEAKK